MIPIRQDKFVAPDGTGHGNCQSAAMASLLELPLADVIDTADLLERGVGFWGPIADWLMERGYTMRFQSAHDEDIDPSGFTIAMGPSPRGDFWHAVVCEDGVIVHDPHPSDAGLVSIETFMFVERIA